MACTAEAEVRLVTADVEASPMEVGVAATDDAALDGIMGELCW